MCDRTGTKTSLVREDTTGNTFLHTHEEASNDATSHRCRVKCAFKDGCKYRWHVLDIQQHNSDCKHDIHYCHKWYQLLCYLSDPLNSAEQNERNQDCKHNSDNEIQGRNLILGNYIIIKQC